MGADVLVPLFGCGFPRALLLLLLAESSATVGLTFCLPVPALECQILRMYLVLPDLLNTVFSEWPSVGKTVPKRPGFALTLSGTATLTGPKTD